MSIWVRHWSGKSRSWTAAMTRPGSLGRAGAGRAIGRTAAGAEQEGLARRAPRRAARWREARAARCARALLLVPNAARFPTTHSPPASLFFIRAGWQVGQCRTTRSAAPPTTSPADRLQAAKNPPSDPGPRRRRRRRRRRMAAEAGRHAGCDGGARRVAVRQSPRPQRLDEGRRPTWPRPSRLNPPPAGIVSSSRGRLAGGRRCSRQRC